jgi:hypothetical protein
MDKLPDIEIRLWEYMDGLGEASERAAVEELIQTNTEWRTKYAELLELNEMLQLTELEAPSMRFTKNVMEEIAHHQIAPATRSYINQRVIWGISAFFITLIAGFIVYAFSQVKWNADTSNSSFGIDMAKVDFSGIFNNTLVNGFMMTNVILGLMLFDRYLHTKRKEYQKQ